MEPPGRRDDSSGLSYGRDLDTEYALCLKHCQAWTLAQRAFGESTRWLQGHWVSLRTWINIDLWLASA